MKEQILIYGHGDKSQFSNPDEIQYYIKEEIFKENNYRYRYTQKKNADIIVISFKGLAYGYFIVQSAEKPTKQDIEAYPAVKKTYIISKSFLYEYPIKVSELGIKNYQFGKYISDKDFIKLNGKAGTITEYK